MLLPVTSGPAGWLAAGLAPHHDDVEIFVVQTEGAKRWCVYAAGGAGAPQGGRHELPNRCSGDLFEADLGPPLMEFILEVRESWGILWGIGESVESVELFWEAHCWRGTGGAGVC